MIHLTAQVLFFHFSKNIAIIYPGYTFVQEPKTKDSWGIELETVP